MDWTQLWSFRGRASRKPYWIAIGINFALSVLSGLASAAEALAILALPLSIIGVWISLAAITRRLHDVGRSGWWQVPPTLAGCVGVIIAALYSAPDALTPGVTAFALVGILIYFVFMVWLGVVKSQPGPNRFDLEPPRETAAA